MTKKELQWSELEEAVAKAWHTAAYEYPTLGSEPLRMLEIAVSAIDEFAKARELDFSGWTVKHVLVPPKTLVFFATDPSGKIFALSQLEEALRIQDAKR